MNRERLLTQEDALLKRCRSALAHHRRRARAAGATLDYGLADLIALARSARVCTYCRTPLSWGILQFDHATATGRPGGQHALHNLRVCCSRCNTLKGMLTSPEYVVLLELLDHLHPVAAADLELRLLAGGKRYQGGV